MQFAYTSSLPLSMGESLVAAKRVGGDFNFLRTSRVECLCSGKKKKYGKFAIKSQNISFMCIYTTIKMANLSIKHQILALQFEQYLGNHTKTCSFHNCPIFAIADKTLKSITKSST